MLVLALDTSTPAVVVGIATLADGYITLLATRVTVNARAHGELLTPQITEAVREGGATLSDLDAVVCGIGPGPFTGLRVGMATAAALGQALEVPVYPVCGLDAIAAETSSDEPFLVATDARRREIYGAVYDASGGRLEDLWVKIPAEVDTSARIAVGDGARLYAEVLGLAVQEPYFPGPIGLIKAAESALVTGASPEPLTPLYLRRPDAAEPTSRKKVSG